MQSRVYRLTELRLDTLSAKINPAKIKLRGATYLLLTGRVITGARVTIVGSDISRESPPPECSTTFITAP